MDDITQRDGSDQLECNAEHTLPVFIATKYDNDICCQCQILTSCRGLI